MAMLVREQKMKSDALAEKEKRRQKGDHLRYLVKEVTPLKAENSPEFDKTLRTSRMIRAL